MPIQEMPPDEVIEPSELEFYKQKLSLIWWQLVQLNSTLFIFEKVLKFPWDVLRPVEGKGNFFTLVTRNFFETAVLIISRLTESTGRVYTLLQFKNDIMRKLIRPQYKKEFSMILKETDFDREIKRLLEKVRTLRDKYIAHLDKQAQIQPPNRLAEAPVKLEDLVKIRNSVNSLFNALCFGHPCTLLPLEDTAKRESFSDLEWILGEIAKNSDVLNMPEKQPYLWPNYKEETLTEDGLKILNQYRRKFGMPEV